MSPISFIEMYLLSELPRRISEHCALPLVAPRDTVPIPLRACVCRVLESDQSMPLNEARVVLQ
jgi:hypothetical protein